MQRVLLYNIIKFSLSIFILYLCMSINIHCYNVRSLSNQQKASHLAAFFNNHPTKPHIIVLTETWHNANITHSLLRPFGRSYSIVSTYFPESKKGVAILYKSKLFNINHNLTATYPEGWHATIHLTHIPSNQSFSITGLYTPSGRHNIRAQ